MQFSPWLHLSDIINPDPVTLCVHVSETNPESVPSDVLDTSQISNVGTHKFLCKQESDIFKGLNCNIQEYNYLSIIIDVSFTVFSHLL